MNFAKESIAGRCKFCHTPLEYRFVDVVLSVNQNTRESIAGEFSLCAPDIYVCSQCFLIQLNVVPLLHEEEFYLSIFSSSWLSNMKRYTDQLFKRIEITEHRLEVEIATHQEHLPNTNEGLVFGNKGLHDLMDMYGKADSLICKDELVYVSDINDFISALKLFLKPSGMITMQFSHLLQVIEEDLSDVLCHGKRNYFSFTTINKMLNFHGLAIFEIENRYSDGQLSIYIKHEEDLSKRISIDISQLLEKERAKGMSSLTFYLNFEKGTEAYRNVSDFSMNETNVE